MTMEKTLAALENHQESVKKKIPEPHAEVYRFNCCGVAYTIHVFLKSPSLFSCPV